MCRAAKGIAPMSRSSLASMMVASWLVMLAGSTAPAARVDPTDEARQANRADDDAGHAGILARGKYLVEDVALCGRCHTPSDSTGEPDRTRWLMGAPIQIQPSVPTPDWAVLAPRLAGLPPGTDDQFVTLLMAGISRTGRPPRPPMPRFRMTRADAEAVLAYLKSLKSANPGS
jgi:mono/diheme cytochrome c family protein